jgi:hypothetical protein
MPYELAALLWNGCFGCARFSRLPAVTDVYTFVIYTVMRVQVPCVESAAWRLKFSGNAAHKEPSATAMRRPLCLLQRLVGRRRVVSWLW